MVPKGFSASDRDASLGSQGLHRARAEARRYSWGSCLDTCKLAQGDEKRSQMLFGKWDLFISYDNATTTCGALYHTLYITSESQCGMWTIKRVLTAAILSSGSPTTGSSPLAPCHAPSRSLRLQVYEEYVYFGRAIKYMHRT